MQSNSQRASRLGSGLPLSVMITIACLMLALITTIWAVVNHNRLSSLEDENGGLRQDNAILRENANATAYTMEPTAISPPDIRGVAYIGTSGSGVVVASNLPPAGDTGVFQLWLVNADESTVSAGTLFTNDLGQGFALIPADSAGYAQLAISLEPTSGSETPDGGFLLVAAVNAARGEQPAPVVSCLLCQNHIE